MDEYLRFRLQIHGSTGDAEFSFANIQVGPAIHHHTA
jgi:hypothetical protein